MRAGRTAAGAGSPAPALLLVALLLPAGPLEGRAQEPGGAPRAMEGPEVLTLEEAIERAGVHNPAYRRATNALELTEIETREAWLDLLPQPSVNVLSTNRAWRRTTVAEDFFGQPIENPEAESVETSRARQGVGLSFQIDPGDYFELRRTSLQGEVRDLDAHRALVALRADVTGAFLEAQEEQTALELEEELLEAVRLNLEVAEHLFRLAREDRTEVLAARLAVAEQEGQVERRRADHRTALLRLRNLVGDPDLEIGELEPVELEVFEPEVLDEEALVAGAVGESPRVVQEEAGLRREEQRLRANRYEWLPTLSFSLGLTRDRFVRDGGAFFDPPLDHPWDRSIAVSVQLPDPATYFRRQNEVRTLDVELRNREETLRELRGEVEEEVRSRFVELRSGYRSVELQERRAELAEERLGLTLDGYRLGRRTFLDLQDASTAAAEARRDALQARYEFQRALLELERALGAPLDAFREGGGT